MHLDANSSKQPSIQDFGYWDEENATDLQNIQTAGTDGHEILFAKEHKRYCCLKMRA